MAENAKTQSLIPEAPIGNCSRWGLSLRKEIFNEAAGINLFTGINLPAPPISEATVDVKECVRFPILHSVAFNGIVRTTEGTHEVTSSLEEYVLGELWKETNALSNAGARANYAQMLSYWFERLGLTSEDLKANAMYWPEPADDVFSGVATKPESYFSAAVAICLWAEFLYWAHGFCYRLN